ncbi:sporulation protein YqfD [Brevibacillus choshinensis]|uniref:Sporulation protein YqfD n=1 Tax=Brevibacillus choshinensis TaxID=54911 RepID=A0ABX7FTK4_BRECH|nr:sporulation protein YqfD [Brevibacillus choshinensis]QRG69571.1 sporulation protein YqfD [Brevibacillus choshinensis]
MRNGLKEWVDGHVTITVRGKRFERFLNMAIRDGIRIWNIRRVGEELTRCDILIRDYFRLRPLLRETGCRSHVEGRGGLPFWLIRLRRRAGLVIGASLFFLGLYMLSSFVWTVEVSGTRHMDPQKVMKAAEQIGIKEGVWKVKLKEPLALQKELMSLLPEATWVGVDIQGTKVKLQVVEKDAPVKPLPTSPRHLVAKKRAVISKVLPQVGKSQVTVNQMVEKGQVLISGIIGNETRQQAVSARGTVRGEVWYVTETSLPLNQTLYRLTGEIQDQQYLLVGPYAVQVWPLNKLAFAHSENTESRFLPSYAGYTSPIGWKTVHTKETEPVTHQMSVEEATEIAKRFAREDILRKAGKDAEIKDEKVLHVSTENGKVYLSIHFSVIEDIAVEQPIVGVPQPPAETGKP